MCPKVRSPKVGGVKVPPEVEVNVWEDQGAAAGGVAIAGAPMKMTVVQKNQNEQQFFSFHCHPPRYHLSPIVLVLVDAPSNQGPLACEASALTGLSYAPAAMSDYAAGPDASQERGAVSPKSI